MSRFQIKPAVKSATKLRLAFYGPSGSGKTMSALRIATGLGGPIGVIDTERGSAAKYSDRYPFDTIELPTAAPADYVEAIHTFAAAGYPVVIVDSLSHSWEWLLDFVDRIGVAKYKGNKWSAWSEATPMQQKLVDALLTYPGHVIATMRSKTEWVTETNERGKGVPVRVGTAPKQREGLEYEFDLLIEMSTDNVGRIIKDRTGRYQEALYDKPGEELGAELAAWLSDGAPAPITPPTATVAEPAASAAPRLSATKAADLARALEAWGYDPIGYAARVLGAGRRPLTDLTTSQAVEVFNAAKAEQEQAAAAPAPKPEPVPAPAAAAPAPTAKGPGEAAGLFPAPPADDAPPFDADAAEGLPPDEELPPELRASSEAPASMSDLRQIEARLKKKGMKAPEILPWLRYHTGSELAATMDVTVKQALQILGMSDDQLDLALDEYRLETQGEGADQAPADTDPGERPF